MTTPEALFGVVPFGRVDFGEARHGEARPGRAGRGVDFGGARHGGAWHGGARRGQEYGKARRGGARHGQSGLGMVWNTAGHGLAWRGRARPGGAWLGMVRRGMECGLAGLGWAGHGEARQGTWAGTSARTTNQHNNMDSESLHSNALMNYAGLLYSAYMKEARAHHNMTTPTWADFVCDPLNKVSVFCWVEVARAALKIETEVRDAQL